MENGFMTTGEIVLAVLLLLLGAVLVWGPLARWQRIAEARELNQIRHQFADDLASQARAWLSDGLGAIERWVDERSDDYGQAAQRFLSKELPGVLAAVGQVLAAAQKPPCGCGGHAKHDPAWPIAAPVAPEGWDGWGPEARQRWVIEERARQERARQDEHARQHGDLRGG